MSLDESTSDRFIAGQAAYVAKRQRVGVAVGLAFFLATLALLISPVGVGDYAQAVIMSTLLGAGVGIVIGRASKRHLQRRQGRADRRAETALHGPDPTKPYGRLPQLIASGATVFVFAAGAIIAVQWYEDNEYRRECDARLDRVEEWADSGPAQGPLTGNLRDEILDVCVEAAKLRESNGLEPFGD